MNKRVQNHIKSSQNKLAVSELPRLADEPVRLAAVLVAPGAVVEGVHGGVEAQQHEVAVVGGEHSLVSTSASKSSIRSKSEGS